MVKFQVFWVKKPYKHCMRLYRYRGILLKVPKRFHEKLEPCLAENFEMKSLTIRETSNEERIDIVLIRNIQQAKM
jgi:hypothetical protein